MRPCFSFQNAASDTQPATLSIYDEIGFWGVQAADFRTQLGAVKSKTVNVEINSPGGDVFAGLAIYNMLRASGKEIVVKVMGVAASAASLIAMAGDKIIMPKNTFQMVHNPWSFAMGNADELRDTAETLDKIGASLLSIYVAKTGMDEAEMKVLLSKDTWLTADESLEKGFATEVVEDIKAKASFDMARADLPEQVKAAMVLSAAPEGEPEGAPETDPVDPPADPVEPPAPADPAVAAQIGDEAAKAGLAEHSAFFALKFSTLDEAKARMSVAKEIKSLCAFAKSTPEQIAAFIKGGQTLAEVRTSLVDAQAKADENVVINTEPKNKAGSPQSRAKPKVDSASIWASHKKQNLKK